MSDIGRYVKQVNAGRSVPLPGSPAGPWHASRANAQTMANATVAGQRKNRALILAHAGFKLYTDHLLITAIAE